ncbi:zinc-ribbon domain-containing protein [Microbulbifer sp. CAU 1566]|uniref:DUF3426 domain-containing protein n=1 Tax=Microbulbifer sp. CAU 1566 TaxID=2933269 RepID=UPI002004BA5C|nr:DUF3426 domain-containing protein [Microbulbifer sp. CAU 1566]MCK7599056.1 zinc-ribbon domain-containing protein [Microbulbifer sp. CAU 1566]
MSQLVTRCPHCSTSFHVSEDQLRAARGAVRCGSCLQVFRADENIVFNEDDPQPASKKAIEELLEDDDFLIHDDIELEGDDSAEGISDEIAPARKASGDKALGAPATENRARQSPLIDDAFGEQQWQELDNKDAQQDLDLGIGEDLEAASEDPWAEEIAREESSGVDSWDHPPRNPADFNEPTAARDEFSFTDDLGLPQAPEDDPFILPDDIDAHEDLERFSDDGPLARASATHQKPRSQPDDHDDHIDPRQRDQAPLLPRDQLISAIGPAPIEVNWQPRRHNRVPAWLWTLGSVLLMLTLAAQVAYFRFDTLSKRDPWRGIYAQLCPLLGCKLPAQVDIHAIHTANLVVRSHPSIPGALAVEAVLLNRAPFDQPFPALQLRFTDLKNAPVASRRFQPQEYLKGELSGRQLMPSGNPVHIALDIVDPGEDAVNYELRIAKQ